MLFLVFYTIILTKQLELYFDYCEEYFIITTIAKKNIVDDCYVYVKNAKSVKKKKLQTLFIWKP